MDKDVISPIAFVILLFVATFFLRKGKLYDNLAFSITVVILALAFITYELITMLRIAEFEISRVLVLIVLFCASIYIVFKKILPQLRRK